MADLTLPSIGTLDPVERAKLRQAMLEKYQQANDMSDVQKAQDNASTQNMIAGIGQGLATIGNSAGVAAGGPAIGGAGFDAQRQAARDALKTAYDAQQAKSNQALAGIQMQQGFDKQDQDLALANNSQALQAANQAQHDREFNQSQNQQNAFHRDEMGQKQLMLQAEQASGKFDTGGQKAADDAFAKEVPDWVNGGREKASKAIDRLSQAQQRLQTVINNGDIISGPIAGRAQAFNPNSEARNIPAIIKESALSAVKEVMGPRITQQEVQNVVDSWYNPMLSEKENAAKLESNINSLKQQFDTKSNMTNYFLNNRGSIKGFQQADTSAEKKAAPAIDPADAQAAAWAQVNPNDPRSADILAHLKSKGQ